MKFFFSSQPSHFSYSCSTTNPEQSSSDSFYLCRCQKLSDVAVDYSGLQDVYSIKVLISILYPWLMQVVRHCTLLIVFVFSLSIFISDRLLDSQYLSLILEHPNTSTVFVKFHLIFFTITVCFNGDQKSRLSRPKNKKILKLY